MKSVEKEDRARFTREIAKADIDSAHLPLLYQMSIILLYRWIPWAYIPFQIFVYRYVCVFYSDSVNPFKSITTLDYRLLFSSLLNVCMYIDEVYTMHEYWQSNAPLYSPLYGGDDPKII